MSLNRGYEKINDQRQLYLHIYLHIAPVFLILTNTLEMPFLYMYVPSVYVCNIGVYSVSPVLVWCRLQTRLLNQSQREHWLKTRKPARTLVICPFYCFHINCILFSLSVKYLKILIPEGSAHLSV